ncbi:hypothetical protein TRIATDRAFT_48483 [Trichoderma atroviride IMI 206040]|uniref:Uncharacterized protein n=1 Tax=Hypocrea atroviridis (strain ATCC 20476 / IMI 206040) TaxID=452589 RepID=G9PCG2_HYPAI|nr:uncharacterized protein TRIATDRAFT_48483 [Trichoderma atroviride IMI 206040]EHK39536.1 hypothetical protein TRIATDRAFT_48483 [Trichoderma atroviride IMI 206040]
MECNPVQVHYNATYDNKVGHNSPLQDSICQHNPVGQHTKRNFFYHEYSYPWPYVGGYALIKKGDNASCFNCYKLQYGGKSIFFRAINSAKDGVDLGKPLFEELSGGTVGESEHISASLSMVDSDSCLLTMQLTNNLLPDILPKLLA